MAWEQVPFPNNAPAAATPAVVSYRVEQRLHFAQGYVELCRYHWSRPVEEVIEGEEGAFVLNMALSTRPAHTWIARVDDCGEHRHREAQGSDSGRLMVMVPGQQYRISAPSGTFRSIRCVLERGKFETLLGEEIAWSDWRQVAELGGPGAEVEGLLGRIHREMRQNRLGRQVAIEAYANALCIEVARRLRYGRPARPELVKGGLAPWRMKLVRDRVNAEAPAPRIAELAELCGLTVRQLGRAFKAETGQTIGQYVDEAIAGRAQRLLAATDRPIAAIAAELGFASAAGFAQAFRRMTGVLPSQLRQP